MRNDSERKIEIECVCVCERERDRFNSQRCNNSHIKKYTDRHVLIVLLTEKLELRIIIFLSVVLRWRQGHMVKTP